MNNFKYHDLVKRLEPGESPEAIAAEKQTALTDGVDFINTPLESLDPISSAEDSLIDQILSLLNGASTAQPIFIHCEHGQDRTGLIVALYRIENDGWTADAAYKEWEAFGHDELHQIFTDDLDSYFRTKSQELMDHSILTINRKLFFFKRVV